MSVLVFINFLQNRVANQFGDAPNGIIGYELLRINLSGFLATLITAIFSAEGTPVR